MSKRKKKSKSRRRVGTRRAVSSKVLAALARGRKKLKLMQRKRGIVGGAFTTPAIARKMKKTWWKYRIHKKRAKLRGIRKVSSKVLAALARGRKKLKRMRHPFREAMSPKDEMKRSFYHGKKSRKRARRKTYIPQAQEPIIITKGESMSRKRKSRKSRRRYSGEFGFEGRKRSRRGRGRRRYYGGGFGGKISPMSTITGGMIAVAGGVAASMAAQYIPVKNLKMKAAVPIALGALLAMLPQTRKNKMLQLAGMGAVVVGAMSLIRQVAPNVPLLTGDIYTGTEMYIPSAGEQQMFEGGGYQVQAGELDGAAADIMEGELDGVELMGLPV